MPRNITLNIFSLTFLLSFSVFSQELKFSRIGADEGLSQSVVNCVIQDKKGFMWFGTDDGLNRYDGYEMRVLKNIPDNEKSLSNNGILCLYEDDNEILWIGTNGGGLNAYDPVTNTFRRYLNDAKNPGSISSNVIKTIFEDREKNLWLGTEEGLNLINRSNGGFSRFTLENGLKNDRIWSICEDNEGILWLATYGGGLHSFDKKAKKFEQFPDKGINGQIRIQNSEKLRYVFFDSKGTLWIGTHGASLCSFDKNTNEFLYFTLRENEQATVVTRIFEDSNGLLWIGTRNGLVAYNRNSGRPNSDGRETFFSYTNVESNPLSLSHNSVSDIFEDRAGSIWVGTNGGGVSAYHKTSNKFGHFNRTENSSNTISSNKTYAFAEDNTGNLWIGTYEGGISILDRKPGSFSNFPKALNNTHDNVLCLFIDSENLLWFGTWGGGINYYDLNKKSFGKQPFTNIPDKNSLCNNSVLCIKEDKNGLLWIGTFKGLDTYNKKTKTFKKYTVEDGLSNNTIQTLLFDQNGNLWIGTAGGGLNFMEMKTGKIKFYPENKGNKGISSNIVNCVYEDKGGNIWVGTVMGLCKMNVKDETFEHFFEKDGLPNDYIYGILEDENGFLWLSTNKGLSKFNPSAKSGDRNRFRNYLVLDGLQDYEYNQGAFYKSKSGEMFFGGQNGFNAFFPQQIIDNRHVPPVHVSTFKIYGKDIELDTNISEKKFIELSYKDNFFSFEFVALDFVLPAKNMYSYKMEGLDEDWNPPSPRRYASYTDLSGGNYIFRVRGANNDGIWNEEGTAIRIRINPPFWKTKWFYALCVLLGVISVFLFIRIRTGQIQKEKRILEVKVAERTRELAQKNKDITDSIQYAKRIQEAILPTRENIFAHLPGSFIFYKPKDIVSGDFYWFYKKENKKIIAVVDCTGHGVPGAFMSMIGHNLLNQIVIEKGVTNPGEILSHLNSGVQDALKQKSAEGETMDGMDVALCTIDNDRNEFEFAGAFRPLYFIKNVPASIGIEKIEGSKFPIGGVQHENERAFQCFKRKVSKGDMVYMFSDGYADQFGGPKGKKFMTKRFQEMLADIHSRIPGEQHKILDEKITEWRGKHEQVDDILVIGIRF